MQNCWMLNLAVHILTHPDQCRGPPCLLCDRTGSFPGVKQPECADDHLPPSSAALQICSSYTSRCPVWLQRHHMGWQSLFATPCLYTLQRHTSLGVEAQLHACTVQLKLTSSSIPGEEGPGLGPMVDDRKLRENWREVEAGLGWCRVSIWNTEHS
jgi:hypothetical protein